MKQNKERKCKNCKFASVNLKVNGMYNCRFGPPTTTPVLQKDGNINLYTNYPLLKAEDPGCSKFIDRLILAS